MIRERGSSSSGVGRLGGRGPAGSSSPDFRPNPASLIQERALSDQFVFELDLEGALSHQIEMGVEFPFQVLTLCKTDELSRDPHTFAGHEASAHLQFHELKS